jgi:hypothetical protein
MLLFYFRNVTAELVDEEETSNDEDDERSGFESLDPKHADEIKKEGELLQRLHDSLCDYRYMIDLDEYVDEDGVRWVRERKRQVQLMHHYQCTWKTRTNHFQRYTDVKAKGSLQLLCNDSSYQKSYTCLCFR